MAKQGNLDRRRFPRFFVGGGVKGQIAVDEATLVDVSLGGALIEHAQVVRPGTRSGLRLILRGGAVSLRCHVVRSAAHRLEPQPDGEVALMYRTGLEFLEPPEKARQALNDLIRSTMETAVVP